MKNANIAESTTEFSCKENGQSNLWTFSCPRCGGNSLKQIESGIVDYDEFTHVDDEGEIDWEDSWMSRREAEIHFECFDCNYVIVDEDGDCIFDGKELVEWLMSNCDKDADEAPGVRGCSPMASTSQSKPEQLKFNSLPARRHDKAEARKSEKGKLGFSCPECGHDRLWQVQAGVADWGVVDRVHRDGTIELGDGDYNYEDAEVNYQCGKCEYLIKDETGLPIEYSDELAAWLGRLESGKL